MNFKPNIDRLNIHPSIWFALGVIDTIHLTLFNTPATTTSLRRPATEKHSLHAFGLAADIRINDLAADYQNLLWRRVKQRLYTSGYDVVLEPDHIHIEYDPKEGRHLFAFNNL